MENNIKIEILGKEILCQMDIDSQINSDTILTSKSSLWLDMSEIVEEDEPQGFYLTDLRELLIEVGEVKITML